MKTFKLNKNTQVYKLPRGAIDKPPCVQLINDPYLLYMEAKNVILVAVWTPHFGTCVADTTFRSSNVSTRKVDFRTSTWPKGIFRIFYFGLILDTHQYVCLYSGKKANSLVPAMFAPFQARQRITKINFLDLEAAWWGGGLPREGAVAEKFVLSLESLPSLGFEERIYPGNFAGMSRTPAGVQNDRAKKVRAHFSFPTIA